MLKCMMGKDDHLLRSRHELRVHEEEEKPQVRITGDLFYLRRAR